MQKTATNSSENLLALVSVIKEDKVISGDVSGQKSKKSKKLEILAKSKNDANLSKTQNRCINIRATGSLTFQAKEAFT